MAHILAVIHLHQNIVMFVVLFVVVLFGGWVVVIMFFGAKCWLLFVCGFYHIRTLVRLLFSEQCVGYNGADVANISTVIQHQKTQ